ncbi:MAG: nitroreductase family protein [bacterium]|nr:nitroreductase family protein [bacterium]
MIGVIKKRISVRTYSGEILDRKEKKRINKALRINTRGPFGNRVRFRLLDLSGLEKKELWRLGTYGFIRGTSLFFGGVIRPGPRCMVDYGYCFERTILELTRLGLGTCWMALTFNKKGFQEKIGLKGNEILPAISPIGYPDRKRSLLEKLTRFMARAGVRKAWAEVFFEGKPDQPLLEKKAGRYRIPLECVRLAPSGINIQPWRVIKEVNKPVFHFFARDNAVFLGIKPHSMELGIAMCHFELACEELRLKGKWKEIKDVVRPASWDYIISWAG